MIFTLVWYYLFCWTLLTALAKCSKTVDTFLHEKSTTPKTSCQSFPQKPGRFIASQYFSECNAATCFFVLDFLFRFMFPCTLLRTSTQHCFETQIQQETYRSSKKKRSVMTPLDLSNLCSSDCECNIRRVTDRSHLSWFQEKKSINSNWIMSGK